MPPRWYVDLLDALRFFLSRSTSLRINLCDLFADQPPDHASTLVSSGLYSLFFFISLCSRSTFFSDEDLSSNHESSPCFRCHHFSLWCPSHLPRTPAPLVESFHDLRHAPVFRWWDVSFHSARHALCSSDRTDPAAVLLLSWMGLSISLVAFLSLLEVWHYETPRHTFPQHMALLEIFSHHASFTVWSVLGLYSFCIFNSTPVVSLLLPSCILVVMSSSLHNLGRRTPGALLSPCLLASWKDWSPSLSVACYCTTPPLEANIWTSPSYTSSNIHWA